jgi:hypothetical protein
MKGSGRNERVIALSDPVLKFTDDENVYQKDERIIYAVIIHLAVIAVYGAVAYYKYRRKRIQDQNTAAYNKRDSY